MESAPTRGRSPIVVAAGAPLKRPEPFPSNRPSPGAWRRLQSVRPSSEPEEIVMASTTATLETNAPPPEIEDDSLYEVINGRREELPPMGVLPTRIASRLGRRLGTFVDDHGLGDVEVEMLFIL